MVPDVTVQAAPPCAHRQISSSVPKRLCPPPLPPAADLSKRNSWQAVMTSGLTPYYKVLGHLQEGDYYGEH